MNVISREEPKDSSLSRSSYVIVVIENPGAAEVGCNQLFAYALLVSSYTLKQLKASNESKTGEQD